MRLQKRHPYLNEDDAERLATRILIKNNNCWTWSWDVRHRQSAAISYPEPLRLSLIENIEVPTSILLCSRSPYIKLPEIRSRLTKFTIPVQTHYIDSGHSPHLGAPTALEGWIYKTVADI